MAVTLPGPAAPACLKLSIDAVGNRNGGGATVLLAILSEVRRCERIRQVTVYASPAHLRQFGMPMCDKVSVVDMPAAESAVGRLVWAFHGLDRELRSSRCNVFLGLNGLGSLRRDRRFASLVFVQQPVPYSREALSRFPALLRLRMGIIRWVKGRSAKAADCVLVQSEAMRDTISRAFSLPMERIAAFMPCAPVLPCPAAHSDRLQPLCDRRGNGVLLYVGSDSPHKNLRVVVAGLKLLPVGRRPTWFVTLPEDCSVCRGSAAVALGALDSAELHEAYRRATLLVMPSLTETVGLPMLEAMRVGTPVLAADRPYAHAVCEDAAAFFDPLSPADFADKVARLLANARWRAQLVTRGHALVRHRDAANPYREMLEKVVDVAGRVRQELSGR